MPLSRTLIVWLPVSVGVKMTSWCDALVVLRVNSTDGRVLRPFTNTDNLLASPAPSVRTADQQTNPVNKQIDSGCNNIFFDTKCAVGNSEHVVVIIFLPYMQ